MTVTIDTDKLLRRGSVCLAFAGVVMICVGARAKHKCDKVIKDSKKAVKNIEQTIEKISNTDPDKLTEEVIQAAAKGVVAKASADAIAKVRSDIGVRVNNAVTSLYDNAEEEAKDRFMKAVDKDINTDDFRRAVVQKASNIVAEKCVDDVKECIKPIKTMIKNMT